MRLRDGSDIYHLIDWVSFKQPRVSHSSYGAEIFVCTEAYYRELNLKQAMKTIVLNEYLSTR